MLALCKGKGHRLDLDSYGGMSTISVDGKAYDMLLLRRLQQDMEGRLYDTQHGFRPNRVWRTAYSACVGWWRSHCHHPPCHLRGLPQKAFDFVGHEVIWSILEAR